ncbi:hypothetical protein [Paracnuella aquatica]|uniref:hypothetical protein n=1 Tax=Paracnuella aquatica TaxID=2268757 RepID=UPI000DEF7E45|nr:hypothetical protein [Paracnuella aquatica]RPD44243.1 hypothetical protein DRJ53_17850 [Paracnuella aquatica]
MPLRTTAAAHTTQQDAFAQGIKRAFGKNYLLKFRLLLCFLVVANITSAQQKGMSLEKLMDLGLLTEAALQKTMAKSGFQLAEMDTAIHFEKRTKNGVLEKSISLVRTEQNIWVQLATTNTEEFAQLNKELVRQDFKYAPQKTVMPGVFEWYQKGPWTATPAVVQQDGRNWYRMALQLTKLPQPADIRYLEDLALLQSHEQLAAVFGPSLVRRDVFYFTENELSKCSVLFPNTSRQVIVVWKDELYSRGISLLIVGGTMQGRGSAPAYFNENGQNQWQSKQGLFVGLPLRQLHEINGGPLEFFGWETEEPGLVALHNKGAVNFKTLGVQLHCIDCNEDRFYSDKPLLNSSVLLQQSRRVYVRTIVLKP